MLSITTKDFRRCSVVTASGRVDAATAPQLEETFKGLTDNGQYGIVLDMSDVEFISSYGLRVLVDARRACRKNNRGDLVLASISDDVKRTLELAGFYTLFSVHDAALDAVANF